MADTATSAAVSARGLRKNYGAVEALRDVSFEIHPGDIVGFAGDNGAGKSTLMKIISGALRPSGGSLHLGEHEVREYGPGSARALGVEMVYQDLALCDNLDIRENIFLGRELRRRTFPGVRTICHDEMTERARAVLESLGIRLGSLFDPVSALSGGQRQAVAIARAIAFQPKLVIMDEPTAALSVAAAAPLLELIRRLPAQGTSVMLVSHRLSDLISTTDRIYVLRAGEIVAELRTGETDEENLLRVMAGLPGSANGSHRV
jgi:simple sugar transport system ATP-binding protein/D-xylose transport system ATP-binding protein